MYENLTGYNLAEIFGARVPNEFSSEPAMAELSFLLTELLKGEPAIKVKAQTHWLKPREVDELNRQRKLLNHEFKAS